MFVDATAHAGLSDAGSDSFAVVFADVDGDGDNDLFVSNAQTGNKLYLNQKMETGELGFLDVTSAAGVGDAGNARAASFVDVDSDGDLDLFVANVGSANSLYINNGKGVFTDEGVARGVAQSGAYTQGVQVRHERLSDCTTCCSVTHSPLGVCRWPTSITAATSTSSPRTPPSAGTLRPPRCS